MTRLDRRGTRRRFGQSILAAAASLSSRTIASATAVLRNASIQTGLTLLRRFVNGVQMGFHGRSGRQSIELSNHGIQITPTATSIRRCTTMSVRTLGAIGLVIVVGNDGGGVAASLDLFGTGRFRLRVVFRIGSTQKIRVQTGPALSLVAVVH